MDQLAELIAGHEWVAVASLLIGLVVRLLKSDTRLPVDVPAQYRPLVAYGLGAVVGALDAIQGGEPVHAALMGLLAPSLAILGHVVGIEGLRGGKELPLPKPLRRSQRETILPPPSLIVLLAVGLGGCAGSFEEARDPGVALGAPPQSERCGELDDRHQMFGGLAKGSAVLGGGAGLATIPHRSCHRQRCNGRYRRRLRVRERGSGI